MHIGLQRQAMVAIHSSSSTTTTVHEAVIRDLNLHLLFSINSKPAGDQKRVRINNTATFFSKFTPTTTKNRKFEDRSVSITDVFKSRSVLEFQFLKKYNKCSISISLHSVSPNHYKYVCRNWGIFVLNM